MKISNFLLLLLLAATQIVNGQANYRIVLTSLTIKGNSNVHKWESRASQLSGHANVTLAESQISQLTNGELEIPVKSIKSSKGSIMDNKTYDALKSDECGSIKFKLSSATINATGTGLSVKGTLTIACQSKTVDLSCSIQPGGGDEYVIKGSKDLKMTDFGIKPPTALLGNMVTKDDITIEFEVKLTK
ncbi:MAG: YceI family protein [Saprospiraceae bacterium]